jgi:hypothetical protein
MRLLILNTLLNVLVQTANKMELQKKKIEISEQHSYNFQGLL